MTMKEKIPKPEGCLKYEAMRHDFFIDSNGMLRCENCNFVTDILSDTDSFFILKAVSGDKK
jgi:hypothetical protein